MTGRPEGWIMTNPPNLPAPNSLTFARKTGAKFEAAPGQSDPDDREAAREGSAEDEIVSEITDLLTEG